MKKLLLLSVWLASTLLTMAADGLDHMIVGTWEYKRHNEGQGMTGYTIYDADKTGWSVGSVTKGDKTVWVVASFTWKIEDSKLIQTIVKSNIPNFAPGKQSKDTIISIDDKWYTHKGGKKDLKELRVTKLPEEFAAQLAKFKAAK